MVEILNDRQNLTYFQVSQNLNHWQACWYLFLSRFYFSLHPQTWMTLFKLDALSHQTNHLTEEEDNHDQVMLSAN